MAYGRAIPADHARKCAALRPSGAVLCKVFRRKRLRTAGAQQHACARIKVECRENPLREPRNLKKKDVPTAQHLPRSRIQKTAHDGGMWHVYDNEFCDALGIYVLSSPSDRSTPIWTGKKNDSR